MKCTRCHKFDAEIIRESGELNKRARIASLNPSSKNVSLALKAKEKKKARESEKWMHIVHDHTGE
jgi:hypothetical protein